MWSKPWTICKADGGKKRPSSPRPDKQEIFIPGLFYSLDYSGDTLLTEESPESTPNYDPELPILKKSQLLYKDSYPP
jgi:hypothetical protein